MRNRILKRPMFRLGGSAENEGIMDGMRKRYEQGSNPDDIDSTYQEGDFNVKPTNQTTQRTGEKPSFRDILVNSPNLSPFLTEFGLNLLSQSPTGNIFQTAATAAKEPYQRMKARGALEGEKDFERELLEKKLEAQERIASSRGGDKMYDMMYKLGLEKFENPALARNYANYFDTIEPTVQAQYGTQFGGVLEQDVSQQKIARQVGKNLDKQDKLNKIFYDVYTGTFKRLIKEQGNYKFVPVAGSANVTDPEGEILPTETDKRKAYQEEVGKFFKEKRKKELDKFRQKYDISSEEDIDI
tara:strand:+ start:157 stop:1053 length:897 start_codon:yes stop_codon:yes gene_type:complete